MSLKLFRTRCQRSRGQGLVEFALVLPILLLILMIALDFGRGFFAWVGVTNASRAGAAYAASHPTAGWSGTPNANIAATYRTQITTDLLPTNCALPTPVPLPVLSGVNLGDSVAVTLTCEFSPLTPIVSTVLGAKIPITATTVYPVRAGEIAGGPVLNEIPAPTATPAPTPTPSSSPPPPQLCDAPQMTGLAVSAARSAWLGAGFTGVFDVDPKGAKDNWDVTAQVPTYPSTQISCGNAASVTASNPNGKP